MTDGYISAVTAEETSDMTNRKEKIRRSEKMAEQKKQEQDVNQLLKVRREKLAELQKNGQNPFEITKYDVTHHSEDIREQLKNWKVRQCL